ncbi:hypothetical protein MMIC_P1282 [Mariprofundus micogutta]|uniref:Uncharacterized protein n=1 Tax=Mariprofundus micogutta TaxID=1921010 RepID=A0A1L8CN36_9PROT|nr:hypothetical protein [Mariprofundus micogutta]GAV20317.1 hypothetical protein MMIC_P1282 [Mariprofundus micogutta]
MKQINSLAIAILLAMGLSAAPAFAGSHGANPCNPCAMKHNPCAKHNPCDMKNHNPCDSKSKNPCEMKSHNPCNPCAMKKGH